MALVDTLIQKASAHQKTILLPEGQDPRVMQAAAEIAKRGFAHVIVLATAEEASVSAAGHSFDGLNVTVLDHLQSDKREQLAAVLQQRRAQKGMDMDTAREAVKDRLYFGNLMVHEGLADGLVAGSIASTPDMLRAAFHCIGTAPGIKTGSSNFVMELARPTESGDPVLLYADCGVNPNPSAEELVDIALATAQTHRALLGGEQNIAFLSFSTKGSAEHELVEKMTRATELTQQRIEAEGLPYHADGELQADAALIPGVGSKKAPNSPVAGKANVLIFPDLQAGNICYKITERLAGANAFGPILQGLAKPVNDLSRGCSAEDIVGVAAITLCQAIG
ncbi:MAG: phosphate acetyltransferase [Verrucomicrobiota bacterium]